MLTQLNFRSLATAFVVTLAATHPTQAQNEEVRQIIDPHESYDESGLTPEQRMFWRRVTSVVHPEGPIYSNLFRTRQRGQLIFERYVVRKGDTLSGLLFERGVGHPNSTDRIYGPAGWSQRLTELNQRIGTLRGQVSLQAGTQILLVYPQASKSDEPITDTATVEPMEPVATAEQQEHTAPTEMAETPPEDMKPERDYAHLFNLQLEAYLGFRYGQSFVSKETPLISKTYFYGLLFELRSGPLSGLRFYWDHAPTVFDEDQGVGLSLGFDRMILGYAFDFDLWGTGHKFHLIPKVGRYDLETHLIVQIDAKGLPRSKDIIINNAVSTGLEADLEYNKDAFTLRGWLAADFPSSYFGVERNTSVRSLRVGIDSFIKGPSVQAGSLKLSSALLLFMANEILSLETKDSDGADGYVVDLDIGYVGIGGSLIW